MSPVLRAKVVTQATTRHQLKDLKIIFPLIPRNFFVGRVVWILQPLKVNIFQEFLKNAEN